MSTIILSEMKGISSYLEDEEGNLIECRLQEYNTIPTLYGNLVPQYKSLDERRKDTRAISLYRSGKLRSISLEEQTRIQTKLGVFAAELLTFFEDGTIDSLFPLNGQISFGWSEEEEKKLAETYEFHFSFGDFRAKVIGLRFYPDGNLRSMILWPGEIVSLVTSAGRIPVRIGFKCYENGCLESVEPAEAVRIKTPIGEVKAYDSTACGVDADKNSLRFNQDGNLLSVTTAGYIIIKNKTTGIRTKIISKTRPGLTEEDVYLTPIVLRFGSDIVSISSDSGEKSYSISGHIFEVMYQDPVEKTICYGDCTKCAVLCG